MIGLVSLCAMRSATFFLFIWVFQSCDVGLWHLQSRMSAAGLRGWLSSKPLSYQSHTTRTKELWEPGKQAHWAICSDMYGLCLLKLWRWAPCRPTSKITAAGLQSNNTAESLQVFQASATNRNSMQSARENVQSSCLGLAEHWLMALLQLTWKMSAAERATQLRHLANRGSYAPLTLWCGVVVRSRDGRLESRDLTRLEDLGCKFEDLSLAWLTLIRVNLTLICSSWRVTWLFKIKYLTHSGQQINAGRGTCLRLEG